MMRQRINSHNSCIVPFSPKHRARLFLLEIRVRDRIKKFTSQTKLIHDPGFTDIDLTLFTLHLLTTIHSNSQFTICAERTVWSPRDPTHKPIFTRHTRFKYINVFGVHNKQISIHVVHRKTKEKAKRFTRTSTFQLPNHFLTATNLGLEYVNYVETSAAYRDKHITDSPITRPFRRIVHRNPIDFFTKPIPMFERSARFSIGYPHFTITISHIHLCLTVCMTDRDPFHPMQ